jgi:hypothetical protein
MVALRTAFAAYRDGWRRVLQAPWIAVLVAGAAVLLTAVGSTEPADSHPMVLDVFEPLGTALMGGALAAALEAGDVAARLGGETAPWTLWLIVVLAGVVLTGGVMDRYARQRPLDARAFWGVSGELAFRLVRLSVLGGALFSVLTGALVVVLDAIATRILDAAGPGSGELAVRVLEVGLGALYLPAAFALFAATDCGRVRMVVERRRSAVFGLAAGARFARRHAAPVAVLYACLFATAGIAWALVSTLEVWLEPGAGATRLLDAVQVASAVVAALVSAAAAVALFQDALAHAAYVAPPPLVWPDSPAIETLAEPAARRDFPPAV